MILSKEPTSELIKFEFIFSSTYWNSPPQIEILSCSLERLNIDRINLRNILWSKSKFLPIYDKGQSGETVIDGECCFGYNGTWELNFSSPVYQYIVDCVRGAR